MAVIRYHSPALPIPTPGIFRNVMFVELYSRLPLGFNGRPPRCLIEWAHAEGGYCLDAPQEMPAGGCLGIWIPDISSDEDDKYVGAAAQLHFERDPDPWGWNAEQSQQFSSEQHPSTQGKE